MKTVISSEDKSLLSLSDLRSYSGLFKYLSLRDVSVRYKQTWVGFGWSIIRPLINIIIFGSLSLLVDKSESPSEKFLMVSAGVIFWQLIANSITEISNSLSANANILTKVYFPKLILPLSSLLVCLLDFVIALLIFLVFFIFLRGLPPWQIVFMPIVVAFGLIFCIGLGLLFATASVKYRDVKFILPFLIQILFYASPVFLSSEYILSLHVPELVKVIYQLNPLVFILNAFKFCFYGNFQNFDTMYLFSSVVITFFLLFISLKYFLSFEKSFADYI